MGNANCGVSNASEWVRVGNDLGDAEIAYLEGELTAAGISVRTRFINDRSHDRGGGRLLLEVPAPQLAQASDLIWQKTEARGASEEALPPPRRRWARGALSLFAFLMGMRIGIHVFRHPLLALTVSLVLAGAAYFSVAPASNKASDAADTPAGCEWQESNREDKIKGPFS